MSSLSLGSRTWISTVFRLVLAAVWLYAGGVKLFQPGGAREAIIAYRIFPASWVDFLGWALPAIEVGLGALLLIGLFTRIAAIASALLHDPEVFVIDEPMVGLDPHHARVVKDTLKARTQRGMTVFLSTHQISVAEEMADRVGIVHRGKLVAVGTPSELHSQAGTGGALESAFLALTEETVSEPLTAPAG